MSESSPRRSSLRRLVRRAGVLLVVLAALPLLAWTALAVAVRAGEFPRARLAPSNAASVVVLDAQGEVLRESASASGGRERWVELASISQHLINATIVSEDRRFRDHRGVDPVGIARAAWLDLRARRVAYGGSTLTMQLVRLLGDGTGGRPGRSAEPRGLLRKWREAVLAGRLERVATKDEILEQYLNRVYYGNGAWGAESAARQYFGKPAAQLSLGEATLLATVPRGPRAYDPWIHQAAALERRHHILGLMVKAGLISDEERALAERTPLPIGRDRATQRAPHFVDWVLSNVPRQPGEGVTVRTSLDGPLQNALEVALGRHLQELGGRNVSEAGVVVLRHRDGAVLGMVGSRDYFDRAGGASNVTTIRRRPGSTLKPFVYGLALERGDSPATVALDLILSDEAHETWTADVRQHGPARYRESLAGSYNLAAVHTLRRVGVGSLVERLRQAGLTTLDRTADGPHGGYDLSLAIGEAEVRLIELAGAYANFGNGGRAIVPRPITSVAFPTTAGDASGSRGAARNAAPLPATSDGARVFSPQIAWLIWNILSDPDARRPMFGGRAPMILPFPVALKTGTTRAYTDNLAFGVTGEYTVAAWAGNFDGTPTDGVMAMRGAAPLVRAALVAVAARFGDPLAPRRPDGIMEADVCPLSGERPGPSCPAKKSEVFLAGTAPTADCSWHVHACGRDRVRWPDEVRPWARFHELDDSARCPSLTARDGHTEPLRIVAPTDGARFQLDAHRPAAAQRPPLRALPAGAAIDWTIDGKPAIQFVPAIGKHEISARLGEHEQRVTVTFE